MKLTPRERDRLDARRALTAAEDLALMQLLGDPAIPSRARELDAFLEAFVRRQLDRCVDEMLAVLLLESRD